MFGKGANRSKPLNKTVSVDLSICLRGGRSSPLPLDVRQSFHGNGFLPLEGVDAASSDLHILGILGNDDLRSTFQTRESEKMSQNSTPASLIVSNWHHKANPQLSSQSAVARHDDENSLNSSEGCKGSSASSDSKTKSENQLSISATKDTLKMSQRETLKVKKKHYRSEKKRATRELMSTLKDPAVVILADWLKVRGSLKSWTKLWCILKPGLIVLYKSQRAKSGHWVATILLNSCEVIERPSKKDGFCFKVYHPLEQSIWATKGPKGETIGAIMQPLPYSYLIFRASSEAAGKCWMDALELALHCPALLARTMARDASDVLSSAMRLDSTSHVATVRREMNETDREMHFKICGLDEDMKAGDKEVKDEDKTETDSEEEEDEEEEVKEMKPSPSDDVMPVETPYVENMAEELGQQGDASQTEEVADENKSLIWTLVKQVRPGMDLSKVVLPTFILEPRSFLDKLSDYYYHADILSEAVLEEDPFTRMKTVLKWYLSGFYKKPRGLKKPYNPILGEMFRCYWVHPRTGSRTFYIAEQICHHPPISAFYVTNRSDGFIVSGSILAKSKFYGNSLSAILDGVGQLIFLKRGEDYHFTMPYAHCKGILIGTLTMEFGGSVSINCEKTGYHAELEFKLKPFLGSGEASNRIAGKIKLGEETLATIDGHWDQEVFITDKSKGITELFWNPNPEVKSRRLKRWTVPLDSQSQFESEMLWLHVSEAVLQSDQESATREKCLLEDEQRKAARERKLKLVEWDPRFFERNLITGHWIYKYADLRPWDPLNDVIQYENNFVIQTKTRHQTPIVLTTSITNVEEKDAAGRSSHSRHSSLESAMISRIKRLSIKRMHSIRGCESGSSTPEADPPAFDSESSLSAVEMVLHEEGSKGSSHVLHSRSNALERACAPILMLQKDNSERLEAIQQQVEAIQRQFQLAYANRDNLMSQDLFKIVLIMLLQLVMFWWFK